MNYDLILAEWKRASLSLGSALLLTREGFYEDAISRAYYAVLHGAKAALYVHEVSATSHAGVKRLFSLYLVRSNEIELEWGTYLGEGLEDRLAADYDAQTTFSQEEAESDCARSRAFLMRIGQYLCTRGLTDQDLPMDFQAG